VTFGSLLLLAVGVSMDAAAVAAARGLSARAVGPKDAAATALVFGGFQALMPLLGWLLGARFGHVVEAWDHWLVFVVLLVLGGRMIHEAREGGPSEEVGAAIGSGGAFHPRVLVALGLATSVDAFAVGLTLPLLDVRLLPAVVTIGVTTALLSLLALHLGKRAGSGFGRRLDAVGGLILILIGAKVLAEHLGWLA
jgi:putative Mn2+ efflux pump MntP